MSTLETFYKKSTNVYQDALILVGLAQFLFGFHYQKLLREFWRVQDCCLLTEEFHWFCGDFFVDYLLLILVVIFSICSLVKLEHFKVWNSLNVWCFVPVIERVSSKFDYLEYFDDSSQSEGKKEEEAKDGVAGRSRRWRD